MYDDFNRSEQTYGYQQPESFESQIYGVPTSGSQSEPDKKKKKKSGVFFKKILGGMVFGLAAGIVFCGVTYVGYTTVLKDTIEETAMDVLSEYEPEEPVIENTKTAPAVATEMKSESGMTVAEIAQNCMPSIVSITNKSVSEVRSMFGTRKYESESAGSGIIIGKNDDELLVATNNHVVEGSKSLSVCFGDSEEAVYEAKIKGTKADNDLAIVAIDINDIDDDVMKTIKIATIGSSDALQIGDRVVAIGNALGHGQSVTTGIVSAKNRNVSIENMSADLIQTDAAINPGNSGGALLNMKGELVGINSAKFASAQVEGMGYAIPIDAAEPILKELMMRQTREQKEANKSGFLGINCQNVDSEMSSMYGIPQGVYVLSVEPGSAAEKAGLRKGDIITEFDGVSITDRDSLKDTLLYYAPGEKVKLTIERSNNGEYETKEVEVTLDRNSGVTTDSEPETKQEMPQGDEMDPFGFYGSPFDYFFGN